MCPDTHCKRHYRRCNYILKCCPIQINMAQDRFHFSAPEMIETPTAIPFDRILRVPFHNRQMTRRLKLKCPQFCQRTLLPTHVCVQFQYDLHLFRFTPSFHCLTDTGIKSSDKLVAIDLIVEADSFLNRCAWHGHGWLTSRLSGLRQTRSVS